jgi:hypothetical protein
MHTKSFWLGTMAIVSLATAPCAVQAQGYGYRYGPPSGAVRVEIIRALYGHADATSMSHGLFANMHGEAPEWSSRTKHLALTPTKGRGKNFVSFSPGPAEVLKEPGTKVTPFVSEEIVRRD